MKTWRCVVKSRKHGEVDAEYKIKAESKEEATVQLRKILGHLPRIRWTEVTP